MASLLDDADFPFTDSRSRYALTKFEAIFGAFGRNDRSSVCDSSLF